MSVKETLNILLSGEYCLVIISIQSFANHNTEIIRLIRETSPFSIMLIVPKPSIEEKVSLYYVGTNACLEQSVDMSICMAQANSLIQLYLDAKKANSKKYPHIFGTELIINPIYRHVSIDGEPLELTRSWRPGKSNQRRNFGRRNRSNRPNWCRAGTGRTAGYRTAGISYGSLFAGQQAL